MQPNTETTVTEQTPTVEAVAEALGRLLDAIDAFERTSGQPARYPDAACRECSPDLARIRPRPPHVVVQGYACAYHAAKRLLGAARQTPGMTGRSAAVDSALSR
jgi:hypothetical protein